MAKFVKDDHFILFAKNLQNVIAGYGSSNLDFTNRQKQQIETLIKLERNFKKVLINDSRGKLIYKAFIKYILDDVGSILVSRPYFRERQSAFASGISPAIKNKNYKALYKFDINSQFIQFVLNKVKWGKNSKITKAAKEVEKIRNEIIQMNLPLAISQARVFRHVTPASHISYMDMMQIASEGLINAVDKFVLPYTPVFRSVIIGRAKGELISNYSETMVHFWPSDKRKIYRANKLQKGQDREETDYSRLANKVNSTGPSLPTPTDAGEIQNLLMASSHFSLDSHAPDNADNEEGETLADSYADNMELRPDVKVENYEIGVKLSTSIQTLTTLEKKLLKMKGIELC